MADFFVNGPSATTVTGTAGDDRLTYALKSGTGGVVLDALVANPGGGYDGQFAPTGGSATPFTGIENFTFIDKVGGNDRIITGGGDDVLTGRAGSDFLSGGSGSDTLRGGNKSDRLFGGTDGDVLYGGSGRDRLFGENGHDSLYGDEDDDTIYGGDGNDFIDGGAGDDRIFGGNGDDFIIADQGLDRVKAGNGDDQVETRFGTGKDLDGGNGRDFLFAFVDDFQPGDNSLFFNMGTGRLRATEGNTSRICNITDFEDFGLHGAVDARVVGTNGANQIFGGQGNDTLDGKGGKDALFGEDGDDILDGGKRADMLDGGADNDILRGGAGTDTFVFSGGLDRIEDFKDDVDTIQIRSSLVASGTTVGDLIDGATVVGGNTVITLDAANVLTIVGLTNPDALADDLVII